MTTQHIAVKNVQVGDRIYNDRAYHPGAAWVTVRRILPAISEITTTSAWKPTFIPNGDIKT